MPALAVVPFSRVVHFQPDTKKENEMHMMSLHRNALALGLALSAVVAIGTAQAAEITDGNVAEHIASAKTGADHQAIAGYYRTEAAAEGERVKLHEAMLASYKQGGGKPYQNMIDHCNTLLGQSRKLQKDYATMAEMHETLAKKT